MNDKTNDIKDRNYIVSWSGGKDSCMALYEAMRQGRKVTHLVNFISNDEKRVRFHGTNADLIRQQGAAMGIKVAQYETDWDGYERDFKAAVRSLLPTGVKGMIFGDIYLDVHKEWVERVCGEIGIEALEPLWGQPTDELLDQFIQLGFEAVVVGVNSRHMDEKWVGRMVDSTFRDYLKQNNIDPCGENGEYHTVVINGPIFSRRLSLITGGVISKNEYRLLDIRDVRLEYATSKPV
ncbi:MAG: diphthine--ammonia ligase [Dehalococcoidia bacterium]|nr:diphthine--ammonia ligase [Dehalococcoidia bacterium]MDD5647659.1 diphthine--ammonia ligase [Dehalococcoidia bacterium]